MTHEITISAQAWASILAEFKQWGSRSPVPVNFDQFLLEQYDIVSWTWLPDSSGQQDRKTWSPRPIQHRMRFKSGCSAVQFVLKYS